jgi:hypothetical protein
MQAHRIHEALNNRKLHELSALDWKAALGRVRGDDDDDGDDDSHDVLVDNLVEFIATKLGVRSAG